MTYTNIELFAGGGALALSMAVDLLGFGTYHGFSPVCVMGGEHLS